jgi:hypothetical protein
MVVFRMKQAERGTREVVRNSLRKQPHGNEARPESEGRAFNHASRSILPRYESEGRAAKIRGASDRDGS